MNPPGESPTRDPIAEVPGLQKAITLLRVIIGMGFLSGIADRFGLWTGRNLGYGNFAGFLKYTAKVNAFMPAATIPLLGWAATVAELVLGLLLIAGIWRRCTAFASVLLLTLFGTAMAVSFGLRSPFDYSVFTAACACLVLGLASK